MTDTEEHDNPGARRLDRRSFVKGGLSVGGALAIGALGEGLIATTTAPGRRRIGPYRRSSQPNILIVMVDQLRSPRWFGAGRRGGSVLAPAANSLAQGGVSFARHYTASNDCSPARAALVTGLHTHQTGCMITGASTLNPGFPTWGALLDDLGYRSWWFGKWHLTSADSHWNDVDGPPMLSRYGFAGGTYPSPNGAPGQGWRVDPHIAGQFEDWLTQEATDEPWCTTVSFVNPHDIAWWWRWSERFPEEAAAPRIVRGLPENFETPAQLEARGKPRVQRSLQDTSARSFGVVPFEGPGFEFAWSPFLDLYVKLQLAVDTQVQRVLDALASRPQVLSNTVVVFTSDHGEYGASHGLRGKGAGAYEEAIRVPLIVADHTGTFGLVPGVRDQVTSSVDFAPLLLTLASEGTGGWRQSAEYAHLATRPDLLAMARDPAHPGRSFALHATDEVLTEYALLPYAADAPLHITAMVTPTHKYAAYSHWKAGSMTPVAGTEEHELYDYSTRAGRLEIANQAGAHPQEEALHSQLLAAIDSELHAPLPAHLARFQRDGLTRYERLAAKEEVRSQLRRLKTVEHIVEGIEQRMPLS